MMVDFQRAARSAGSHLLIIVEQSIEQNKPVLDFFKHRRYNEKYGQASLNSTSAPATT